MKEKILEIIVRNYPDNRTMVSGVGDPLLDAKLLLEGVGVLVKEIENASAIKFSSWKEDMWGLSREEIRKKLREYLEITLKDY